MQQNEKKLFSNFFISNGLRSPAFMLFQHEYG